MRNNTIDGILHITLTKNNTLITLTNTNGNVLAWTTCNNCGFHGSQKSTAIATITASEKMGLRAVESGIQRILLIFHGGAKFRQAVLRGLLRSKITIQKFILKTNFPYNGCRLKKPRRK